MVQEVPFFFFFSVGLKGQDSVKLNFIHTVSLAAWLKCSHGSIQLSTISQHLHSTLSSTLTLNLPPMPSLWNIPALFKLPHPPPTYQPITEGSSWTCADFLIPALPCTLVWPGLAPNCYKPILYAYTRDKYLPQRVTARLNTMPRNGWQAAFRRC